MEGGTYALYEPVFIRQEDSGTKESPTVIRSVADEKVVLSGGVRTRIGRNKESSGWQMCRHLMGVHWIFVSCG